ncbi:MAG: F0F1 ATP synthase subunit alpha [Erysipelotrichaceae bacterium]|nr:F0F1 ATP synthase subunit alpha [Erysipelotrichaceae bacterium]
MKFDITLFAKELLELARYENKEETFFRQLQDVNEALGSSRELKQFIDDPDNNTTAKLNKLQESFNGALDENVVRTFFQVNDKIPLSHSAEPLLQSFIEQYYNLKGYLYGTAYSIRKLDDEELEGIEKAISSQLAKPVKIGNKIDASLLGGVRVEVGDSVWDGSYRTKLGKLRRDLLIDEDIQKAENIEKAIAEKIAGYDRQDEVDIQTAAGVGYVTEVADGIVKIKGLKGAMAGELLKIQATSVMAMNLEEDSIGAVLLDSSENVREGSRVVSTRKIIEVPVGDTLLGRVVDAMGRPIDGKGVLKPDAYYPIERPAPGVIDRQSVNEPLETGLKVIDSMIPIGKGQRELIIGDRQTGKTAIAIDTIINQKGKNVKCIYVSIGQKNSYVAQIVEKLRQFGAMSYTTVVCSNASELAALQYIAPYAGCAIGEYWMERGEDVLIVYDDLSKHAIAYRTLSLLLRRPPGREAYPGDVFYLHSRLLERSAKLSDERGGGSLTALPIIETLAGDISAYIPTNVISITDGQIFLQTELFNSGFRPAVDSGLSVSRVGSAAQIKAMKQVSGSLKLDLAQYQEVLDFAQFGSDLDPVTKKTIAHGQHLMAILKQPQYSPVPIEDQIMILLAAQEGLLEDIPVESVGNYTNQLISEMHSGSPELISELLEKQSIDSVLKEKLIDAMWVFTDRYRRSLTGA